MQQHKREEASCSNKSTCVVVYRMLLVHRETVPDTMGWHEELPTVGSNELVFI